MRNSLVRKSSPLAVWRAQYNYVSSQIRETKDVSKSSSRLMAQVGPITTDVSGYTPVQIARIKERLRLSKSVGSNQRIVNYLRGEARRLMEARNEARDSARALWKSNQHD